jgi:phosphopantetheine--protein transferase-like protein
VIGIDAVDIERLRYLFRRSRAVEFRLFTPEERRYCNSRVDPVMHFAGTLAVKEAVIKAARLGPLVAWSRRIEVEREPSGIPRARIHGIDHGPIDISISHDGSMAVAIAVHRSREGARKETAVTDDHDHDASKPNVRPNQQLARYVGLGHRSHHPHEPDRAVLPEASSSVVGTDFP